MLGTTELLEMILLYLPPRDTTVSMRVCRHWNECVHSSTALSRHLCMLPSGSQVQQVLWGAAYCGIGATYPLRARFKLIATTSNKAVRAYYEPFNAASLTPGHLCPLLRLHYADKPITQRLAMSAVERVSPTFPLERIGRWAGMYLTDPPCVGACFSMSLRHNKYKDMTISFFGSVSRDKGIRFQDIMDNAAAGKVNVTCNYPWLADLRLVATGSSEKG